ncbi:hypothetical protein ACLI4Y_01765 [Natrialbaceae archaeon A-CW3]
MIDPDNRPEPYHIAPGTGWVLIMLGLVIFFGAPLYVFEGVLWPFLLSITLPLLGVVVSKKIGWIIGYLSD